MAQSSGEEKKTFTPEGLFKSVEVEMRGTKDAAKNYLNDVGFLDDNGKVKSENLEELKGAREPGKYPQLDILQYIAQNSNEEGYNKDHSYHAFVFLLDQGMKWEQNKNDKLSREAKEFGDTVYSDYAQSFANSGRGQSGQEPKEDQALDPVFLSWTKVDAILGRVRTNKAMTPDDFQELNSKVKAWMETQSPGQRAACALPKKDADGKELWSYSKGAGGGYMIGEVGDDGKLKTLIDPKTGKPFEGPMLIARRGPDGKPVEEGYDIIEYKNGKVVGVHIGDPTKDCAMHPDMLGAMGVNLEEIQKGYDTAKAQSQGGPDLANPTPDPTMIPNPLAAAIGREPQNLGHTNVNQPGVNSADHHHYDNPNLDLSTGPGVARDNGYLEVGQEPDLGPAKPAIEKQYDLASPSVTTDAARPMVVDGQYDVASPSVLKETSSIPVPTQDLYDTRTIITTVAAVQKALVTPPPAGSASVGKGEGPKAERAISPTPGISQTRIRRHSTGSTGKGVEVG